MKPKFTDAARYPNGYRTAAKMDVAATFKRIRAEQKARAEEAERNKVEAEVKVRDMKARRR